MDAEAVQEIDKTGVELWSLQALTDMGVALVSTYVRSALRVHLDSTSMVSDGVIQVDKEIAMLLGI